MGPTIDFNPLNLRTIVNSFLFDISNPNPSLLNNSRISTFVQTLTGKINFKFNIKHAPGSDHSEPIDYSIINLRGISFGLFDLNLAQGVDYFMEYSKTEKTIFIKNKWNEVKSISLNDRDINSTLTLFKNVNAVITDFVYIDENNIEHTVYNKCPHFKCGLVFNETEKTWDCPCHGSRFDIDGKCIEGPSNYDIIYKNSDKSVK